MFYFSSFLLFNYGNISNIHKNGEAIQRTPSCSPPSFINYQDFAALSPSYTFLLILVLFLVSYFKEIPRHFIILPLYVIYTKYGLFLSNHNAVITPNTINIMT